MVLLENMRSFWAKGKSWALFFVLTLFYFVVLVPFVTACDKALVPVAKGELPLLLDDVNLQGLKKGVAGSVAYLTKINQQHQFEICERSYSAEELRLSLELFLQGLDLAKNAAELQHFLFENFIVCQAAGKSGAGSMLVTGYYEPFFKGSLEKKAPYLHPLYGVPADLIVQKDKSGKKLIGRLDNQRLIPYWTRAEIESGNLLSGQEVLFLADPVDAFILHVQGSGRVLLADGTVRKVQFAGSNGREYQSIGRLLVDRGVMSLKEVTMPAIVDYLHDHPEEMQSIFHHNDRYIFFNVAPAPEGGEQEGPTGSLGQPLTAGRSVALDTDCFPGPMVGYLESERPFFDGQGQLVGWEPLHRFVLNQDTGAAIKGPGRIDFFWGSDGDAQRAAGVMKQPGRLYFLLLKK